MTDKQIIAQVLTKANIKYTINKHALLTENFKNKQNTLFVFDEQGNLRDIYNGKDGHKIELLKTDLSVS